MTALPIRLKLTRSLALCLLLCLSAATALSAAGCGATRTYEPDTTIVARVGHQTALERLRAVIGSATNPAVHKVDVTEELMAFEWMRGGYTSEIRFARIDSLDITSGSHTVTIRMRHLSEPYRFSFTREDDAHAFVDLLASFHYESQGPAARPLPVTRENERL
ncbi:MAG: hypothetical protein Tsb0020_11180 [Haliangiales bacterium]